MKEFSVIIIVSCGVNFLFTDEMQGIQWIRIYAIAIVTLQLGVVPSNVQLNKI